MDRRGFLRMIGLAPAAALPAAIEPETDEERKRRWLREIVAESCKKAVHNQRLPFTKSPQPRLADIRCCLTCKEGTSSLGWFHTTNPETGQRQFSPASTNMAVFCQRLKRVVERQKMWDIIAGEFKFQVCDFWTKRTT